MVREPTGVNEANQFHGPPQLQALESTTVEDVYRDYGAYVWRVTAAMNVPPSEREDVVHDVFLVVHRRLDEFDGRAAMTSWLYGITRGVVRNRRRGEARMRRKLEVLPTPPATRSPDEHAEQRRAAEVVRMFLARLDEDKRLVFELMEIQGMSAPEVAEALGIKLNTVYSRLRAARKRFDRHLTKVRKAGCLDG